MPAEHVNRVSEGRDFAMFERNLLSHLRLAVTLSLLSASLLLDVHLPTPFQSISAQGEHRTKGSLVVGVIECLGAIIAIGAGVWEYWQGYMDLKTQRGFLRASQTHLAIMSILGMVVFATCLLLISDN